MNCKNNLIPGREKGSMPACLLKEISHSSDSLFDHLAGHARAKTMVVGRTTAWLRLLSYAHVLFFVSTQTSLQDCKDGLGGVILLEGHSVLLPVFNVTILSRSPCCFSLFFFNWPIEGGWLSLAVTAARVQGSTLVAYKGLLQITGYDINNISLLCGAGVYFELFLLQSP